MNAIIDIKFDELVKIVKSLPYDDLFKLKAEIEKENHKDTDKKFLKSLLLNGPTFSKKTAY